MNQKSYNSTSSNLNIANNNILFPKKSLMVQGGLFPTKDETMLKYTNSSGALNNNNITNLSNLNKPREFGRDLTNIIQIPQKKYGGVPNKYMNLIKPSRKEKEELKKQLTKNDVSLYNLRPRGASINNNLKNNSRNNSFTYNNENENSNNIPKATGSIHNAQNTQSGFVSLKNLAQVINKPKVSVSNRSIGVAINSSNNISSNDMEVDSVVNLPTQPEPNNQEVNFKSNFFNFVKKEEKNEKLDKFLNTNQNMNTNMNINRPASHITHNIQTTIAYPTAQASTQSNQINPLPQNVSEYILDIYHHLKSTELHFYPKYGYMKSQPDINEKMRAILIDWLVDVHLKFKLVPETLFLTTQIIDRFLERTEINRNKLQLVGVTSLFIACKYEEIYPPELKDFVYITDKAYTKSDILTMEKEILNGLNFDITHPSTLRLLDVYIQLLDVKFDDSVMFYFKYLLELFLIEYKMIKYSPSLIAAATIFTTLKVKKLCLNRIIDIPLVSGFPEEKLKECARDILIILDGVEKTSLQAVRNKYSSSKYMEVAKAKKTN